MPKKPAKKGKKGGDDARPVRQVRTSCAFPPQALPHGVSWGFAKFVLLVTHVWLQPIEPPEEQAPQVPLQPTACKPVPLLPQWNGEGLGACSTVRCLVFFVPCVVCVHDLTLRNRPPWQTMQTGVMRSRHWSFPCRLCQVCLMTGQWCGSGLRSSSPRPL